MNGEHRDGPQNQVVAGGSKSHAMVLIVAYLYVKWMCVELPLPNRGNVFYAMRKDVIDVQFLIRRRSDSKHKHTVSKPRSRSLARLIF